ncbi:hypothetical protein [Dysgonomonas sp. 520]|uniref:hypothetical protein n=1 Tax=Dysgonomonas sp. 520 TaxID=2302931 RepID=UPI0013D2BCAD|nr:hypothetical protein [Dysgonomonas sp. 520]NDW10474.1 hypothetical protein [Dysgonomonas sp. 520]
MMHITEDRARQLHEESMRRMHWRLWFAFRDSKYTFFRANNRYGVNFKKVTEYCLKHWGKEIKDMTEAELSQRISIVSKWKDNY